VILFIALPETQDNLEPGLIPLGLLPRLCPLCHNDTIIGHGRRLRQANDDKHQRVWVRRGICRSCRQTFTILPERLIPFAPFTLRCRKQACDRISAGDVAEHAAPHCRDPSRLPDPDMTMRYLDVTLTDLKREFELARSKPRHLTPQPTPSVARFELGLPAS